MDACSAGGDGRDAVGYCADAFHRSVSDTVKRRSRRSVGAVLIHDATDALVARTRYAPSTCRSECRLINAVVAFIGLSG